MADSTFFTELTGLDRAFEIQGGLHGPSLLRTDSGIYLYHDVGDYLSRAQTYQFGVESAALDTTGGGGDFTINCPDSNGVRFGRYLMGVWVSSTSIANLAGWAVFIRNSGKQPPYPELEPAYPIMWGGANARQYTVTDFLLNPDSTPFKFPVWMPPGSFLQVLLRTTAASGIYQCSAGFNTTELQNATGAPIGPPRAPVKV